MFQYGANARVPAKTIRAFYFSNATGRVPYTDLTSLAGERNQATGQYTVGDYTIISSSQPYTVSTTSITSTSYINGTEFTTNGGVTADPIIGTTRFSVGAGADTSAPNLTHYLTGNVAEILVYSTVLSTSEIAQVEGYLARKWALSDKVTRSDHPYKSTAIPKGPYLKPFAPTDITGCVAWFDASDLTTVDFTGAVVTGWRDKTTRPTGERVGGAGGLLANGSPAPVFESQNGLNTFKFSGSNGFSVNNLTNTYLPFGIASGTYFVVGRTTSVAANPQMMFQYGTSPIGNVTNRQFYFTTDGTKVFTDVNQTGRVETGTGQYTNGQYTIISSNQTVVSTTLTTNSRINGTAFSVNNDITTTTANVGSAIFSVGRGVGPTNFPLTGNVAEILIYEPVLSEGDRLKVEGYLAWKWGIRGSAPSIPETHSFYKFPSATVTS
jgi:hypothetical protein